MQGADGISVAALAKETGIQSTTLSSWLSELAEVKPESAVKSTGKALTIAEKIKILSDIGALSGEARGAYLRRVGIGPKVIAMWEAGLSGAPADRSMQRQIKTLERELNRKEKALAEAAALLILKKKVQAYCAVDADENTTAPFERS